MKKIRICSVVVGNSLKEFLEHLDHVQEDAEMVELRVDLIKNLSLQDLIRIKKITKKQSIVTCRSKEIFEKALELRFDLVDIDMHSVEKGEITIPNNVRSRLIISFHDFKKTPDENELKKIVQKIARFQPDIIKIATMVKDKRDNFRLIRLMTDFPSSRKKIIIGMGNKGKALRVLGPMLGNYLTYAATDFGRSAPGQIHTKELKKIYTLIN